MHRYIIPLQWLTALCFPSAAELKAKGLAHVVVELGLEPCPALCCLFWSRVLKTSLIHVLLDKSIRSAWISLFISLVHCHVALWSLLSYWDGKAPRQECWQRSMHWGWWARSPAPPQALHHVGFNWRTWTGLHSWGKTGQKNWLWSSHHLKGQLWFRYVNFKLPKQC